MVDENNRRIHPPKVDPYDYSVEYAYEIEVCINIVRDVIGDISELFLARRALKHSNSPKTGPDLDSPNVHSFDIAISRLLTLDTDIQKLFEAHPQLAEDLIITFLKDVPEGRLIDDVEISVISVVLQYITDPEFIFDIYREFLNVTDLTLWENEIKDVGGPEPFYFYFCMAPFFIEHDQTPREIIVDILSKALENEKEEIVEQIQSKRPEVNTAAFEGRFPLETLTADASDFLDRQAQFPEITRDPTQRQGPKR